MEGEVRRRLAGCSDPAAREPIRPSNKSYANRNFFHMVPASPINPLPNKSAAAGSGTGAGAFTTVPLETLVLAKGVPTPLSVAAKRSVRAP